MSQGNEPKKSDENRWTEVLTAARDVRSFIEFVKSKAKTGGLALAIAGAVLAWLAAHPLLKIYENAETLGTLVGQFTSFSQQSDLPGLRNQLSTLNTTVGKVETRVEQQGTKLDQLSTTVDDLPLEKLSRLETIDRVDERTARLESNLGQLRTEVGAAVNAISTIKSAVAENDRALQGVTDKLSELGLVAGAARQTAVARFQIRDIKEASELGDESTRFVFVRPDAARFAGGSLERWQVTGVDYIDKPALPELGVSARIHSDGDGSYELRIVVEVADVDQFQDEGLPLTVKVFLKKFA